MARTHTEWRKALYFLKIGTRCSRYIELEKAIGTSRLGDY